MTVLVSAHEHGTSERLSAFDWMILLPDRDPRLRVSFSEESNLMRMPMLSHDQSYALIALMVRLGIWFI